ncbi:hypothetical protein IU481_15335 [Nocardia otitidiscaviarum]|nr:hypothetical protein [Nocardia otitidiscaviarum]
MKVSTSLTVAGAAVAATLMSTPANAVPNDPNASPTAPAQPGEGENPEVQPRTGGAPAPQPDNTRKPENRPTPSQPGVNPEQPVPQGETPGTQPGTTQPGTTEPGTAQPGTTQPGTQTDPGAPAEPGAQTPQPSPSQPGVTTPRVAPLPVPGQQNPAEPAVNTPRQPGTTIPAQPEAQAPEADAEAVQPDEETPVDTLTSPETVQPRWEAPVVETAPAAPVVEMTGPHTEVGANVDGGALLPGFAANTHHFSNLDGYVGTVGYSTPGGYGEAGVSLEFIEANTIKVTGFVGGGGAEDRKVEFTVDTTQANAAKAAAEGWIRLQPGGAAALAALGEIGKLPQGELPAQTIEVGGATTQWGGSVQY